MVQHHKFLPIIIEGDSQILINIAKKLLWGTTPEKVAHSWRLEARIKQLSRWLMQHRAVSFNHIKREGNKVADLLANLGTEGHSIPTHGSLHCIHDAAMLQQCITQVHSDSTSAAAGV